jgi:DNA repair protein RecN (Recombination protein N)
VVDVLGPDSREEEIARMLSGSEITEAARAAARALMHA